MALSQDDREKRFQMIHVMESILGKESDSEYDSVSVPVDEAADSRMKSLEDIQTFLSGKTLPYLGTEELESLDNSLDISILFMSTNDVKVDPNRNFLHMSVDLRSDSGRCRISTDSTRSCKLEKFIGLPKKVDSPDFKSVSDVTKLCNAPEIYNIYRKDALDIVRMRMPAAYSMFTGSSISHYQIVKGDVWWTKYNLRTLAVTFDKRFNKFTYVYYPEFILECALDEWSLSREKYRSLKDCYCYVLAFLITHEMMHLIHHNTTSTIDMGDVGGHRIVNIQQDSFINCQISRVFSGVKGISSYGLAPMPRMGIGSSITVRAEHNRGFKSYENSEELSKEIAKVISSITKVSEYSDSGLYVYNKVDLTSLVGADVFITVDIHPTATELRSNSGIFQKLTNELIKTITDGRVYDKYSKLSDAEKETDKPIMGNGTLVQVKGTSNICAVNGYDESSKEYDLVETEMSVERTSMGSGQTLCTPKYTPTDISFGKRRRMDIRPFDPESNTWIEEDGEREKKSKLTDEDLQGLESSAASKNVGIIDLLIQTAGGSVDLVKQLVEAVLTKVGLNSEYLTASDIVDECRGKSDDECKVILGEIVYDELKNILNLMSGGAGVPQMPQMPQSSQDNSPVFHIGDIVWVRRKRKFGKIVSINNGMFELEEMEEVGVRVLDDSSYHKVSEGFNFVSESGEPKMVLKERVFAPTGRMLGTFPVMDLETFDIEYTESTESPMSSGNAGGEQSSGKQSTVPKPKDDNPIKPEESEKSDNDSGSDGSGTSGSGDSGSSSPGSSGSDSEDGDSSGKEDDEDWTPPDDWDVNGQDLDDEEPVEPDTDEVSYGDGEPGSGSSGDEGDPSDGSGDSEGSGDSLGSGDSGEMDPSEDESDEDDYEDSESDGDSGEGDPEDGSGDSSGEGSDGQDGNSSGDNSGSSSSSGGAGHGIGGNGSSSHDVNGDDGESGNSSSSGNSDEMSGDSNEGDIDYDESDWDPSDDYGNGMTESDLEKALGAIESSESESSKSRRVNEEEREDENVRESQNKPNPTKTDPNEVKAAKDMLGKAIKETRNQKSSDDSTGRRRNDDIDENDILGSMGAGSLTSAFVPKMANDWKVQLEKILDMALGFDIITNPNLVNKKLEDAPPGREDDVPDIKNIAIMLDCSGSMGAKEFVQVIQHLDTMFMVRKMDKTTFHIIDWGDGSIQSVAKTYTKVKGRMFKREIMKHTDHGWGTQLVPGFMVASQRIHKPDAILILTDAEIWDAGKMGVTPEGKIAQEFVKKYRKKIIWVLTANGNVSTVKDFDPTAKDQKRIIKFRK